MLPLVDHCVSLPFGDMWDNKRALAHPIYLLQVSLEGEDPFLRPSSFARQKAAFCTVGEIEEHKDSS